MNLLAKVIGPDSSEQRLSLARPPSRHAYWGIAPQVFQERSPPLASLASVRAEIATNTFAPAAGRVERLPLI